MLLFYKQVLGLSGSLTGLAIFLSVVWDAVSDPMVGAWSDRIRSRWGRRHPLMLLGGPLLALSFVALFSPPQVYHGNQWPLFLWLLGSVIALRTALTLFFIPYLALGAEISTDYHERSHLASVRTHIGWAVGVAIPSACLAFLFTEVNGVDGRFVVAHYLSYGWVNFAVVLLATGICLWGTWRYIPGLPQAPAHAGNMLREAVAILGNANFRRIMMLDIAIGAIGGVFGALLMVTYTYFWQLHTAEISFLFAVPPLLAILLTGALSRGLTRRFEKQQILSGVCVLYALNFLWLTPLALLGWLPQNHALVMSLIVLQYVVYIALTILRTVANHSILADIVDEHELATGRRQEGVMFAAATFAAKFVTGFGYLVGGPYLDLIGLETGMQPGEAPWSVILGLGIIMGPGVFVVALVPIAMARRLDMSLQRLQQVQAELAGQRSNLSG